MWSVSEIYESSRSVESRCPNDTGSSARDAGPVGGNRSGERVQVTRLNRASGDQYAALSRLTQCACAVFPSGLTTTSSG